LKVRGRLQPAEWAHNDILRKRDVQGPDGILPAIAYFDALEPEFANGNPGSILVFLLKVASNAASTCGSVLRQQSDGKFSRLGAFSFQGFYPPKLKGGLAYDLKRCHFKECLDLLNGSPIQTITIV
jgi:hypothetical protein